MSKVEIKAGIYRHFKGEKYEVLGVARSSETEQYLVVYRALYGERELWVRPYAMFTEMVEVHGMMKPRFEYLAFSNDLPDTDTTSS